MAAWSLFSKLKEGFSGADGPPKMESFALHLYGKLPIYKDFISSGLTEEGARDFRDWIGNGFSRRWSVVEEYKAVEIPLHTFLIPLPGGKRSVAGALWGSHDEGGHRRFPFTLFSVLPPGKSAADAFVALSYLEVFADRAAYIRRNFAQGRTLASFYETYRGARIEVPVKRPARIAQEVEKEAKVATLSDFAESILGSAAPAEWPGFLERLKSACRNAPGTGAGAVRVPLGNLLPAELQVQIWLTWLEAEGVLGDRGPSGTLVCRAGGRSRAVLFFRDLRPEDFLLLHPEAADYEFVEETLPAAPAPAPDAAAPDAADAPAPPAESAAGSGAEAAPGGEGRSGEEAKTPAGWSAPLAAFLRPAKADE